MTKALGPIPCPEHAEPRAVVRLINNAVAYVHIVIDRWRHPLVGANQDRPVEIGEDNAKMKITWSDKTVSEFPFEFLRNHCPCAVCVDEWTGERKNLVLLLPSDFRPMNVSPVGNYAIQIAWSDGHNTGIYSYKSLRELDPKLAVS